MRIQNPMYENTVARGPAAARADLQPEESALISRIIAKRLTYLPEKRVASLLKTIRSIEKAKLPGIFIEAGCALGGSASLIAS